MFKRVSYDGPGDDPDEYWFECPDCEGSGQVHIDDEEDESLSHLFTCPDCNGLGKIEGDASDVE